MSKFTDCSTIITIPLLLLLSVAIINFNNNDVKTKLPMTVCTIDESEDDFDDDVHDDNGATNRTVITLRIINISSITLLQLYFCCTDSPL